MSWLKSKPKKFKTLRTLEEVEAEHDVLQKQVGMRSYTIKVYEAELNKLYEAISRCNQEAASIKEQEASVKAKQRKQEENSATEN